MAHLRTGPLPLPLAVVGEARHDHFMALISCKLISARDRHHTSSASGRHLVSRLDGKVSASALLNGFDARALLADEEVYLRPVGDLNFQLCH